MTLQVGLKRKREFDPDDASQGASRAHQFLKEFAELPLDQMDIKEALQRVRTMKTELEKDAESCPWLQQLL